MRPGPIDIIKCPRCGALSKQRTIGSGNSMGARVWTDGKVDMPMMPDSPDLVRCRACQTFYRAKDAVTGSMSIVEELDAQVWAVKVTAVRKRSWRLLLKLRWAVGDVSEEALAAALPVTVATGLKHLKAADRAESLEKMGAEVACEASIPESYQGSTPRAWLEAPDLAHPGERDLLDALALGVIGSGREERLQARVEAWHAANDVRRKAQPVASVEWSPEARENLAELLAMLAEGDPKERLLKAEALREMGRFEEALALLAGVFPEGYAKTATLVRSLAERRLAGVAELPRY